MNGIAVVALGGNVLTGEDQAGTHEEQRTNARQMARAVAGLLEGGHRVVITHGNGPQVGNLAIQQEEAAGFVPAHPLSVLGAMTQGQIGHLLGLALREVTSTAVVSVVTHVEVDPSDPAFEDPTKPIGPFFERSETERLASDRGWVMTEDAGRGMRRVVPSPDPKAILEAEAVRALVDEHQVVIAAGGGGIPVIRRHGRWEGVDAVIDKDFAAERLASSIGADTLIILTGVDRVAVDFGTPRERALAELSLEEARTLLDEGQFPPGSMGPKVRAAIRFLEAGGNHALITSPRRAAAAMTGSHGTRIVPGRAKTAAGT